MGIDLKLLEENLDLALKNETPESFQKWYDDQGYGFDKKTRLNYCQFPKRKPIYMMKECITIEPGDGLSPLLTDQYMGRKKNGILFKDYNWKNTWIFFDDNFEAKKLASELKIGSRYIIKYPI